MAFHLKSCTGIAQLTFTILLIGATLHPDICVAALSFAGSTEHRRQQYDVESLLNSRISNDISLDNWFKSQGIRGMSRLALCSSPSSVGGRGVFWTDHRGAKAGDVLAYIDSSLIFVPSNINPIIPSLARGDDGLSPMDNGEISWQAAMAASAYCCLEEPDIIGDKIMWIQSWFGGGPSCPRPASTHSRDELQELAGMADTPIKIVREALDARYETFQKDYHAVAKMFQMLGIMDKINSDMNTFGDLYSIAVSRTANLGPEWDGKRGIIPLHDMLNHHAVGSSPNVELLCVGDMKKAIADDTRFMNLMQPVCDDDSGEDMVWNSKDAVLVASRDIVRGDELWLSYIGMKQVSSMCEKERIWRTLQYGFSLGCL